MNRQMKTTIILAIAALFSLGGCGKWYKDEELTLEKQPYNGNELRLDGYYYYRLDDGRIWNTYFYYHNGIMLYGIETDTLDENLDKYDAWYRTRDFLDYIKKSKSRWGLFQIHGDSIVFERLLIDDGGFPVGRFSGNILNDTTFIITKEENPYSGNVYPKNELYHFRALSPKPDSTNVFIP